MTSLTRLTLALATLVIAACGTETETTTADGSEVAASPTAMRDDSTPACLPAADVSAAVGLEMREFPSGTRTVDDAVICAYQGADTALGAFVTTTVGPSAGSEEVFGEMEEAVRLFLGASAAPEAIDVGERGYAYGSMSKSVAAAVSGDRLYYAEVVSTASADIGDKKAAMVAIIEAMMAL